MHPSSNTCGWPMRMTSRESAKRAVKSAASVVPKSAADGGRDAA